MLDRCRKWVATWLGGWQSAVPLAPVERLSDDELEAIGYALADPLAPRLAVALSSCSRGLRRALAAPLKELKERRQKAEELCAFVSRPQDPWSCDRLSDATQLHWSCWDYRRLTAAHSW